MLEVFTSRRFEKDFQRLIKGGKDPEKIKAIIGKLAKRQPLDPRHRDHKLTGPFTGYRECHIEPDWLIIYDIDEQSDTLNLSRTGTHSDLFG